MPIFSYNNIDINYIKEGQGEPLVLVSGSFTKLQSWNYQIDFFKDKMTVIAFDKRGEGKSSRPDYHYTMEMFVEDFKNLCDYLNIKEGIHLCGSSMGAMIAQRFVLKYPEMIKTLILCSTFSYYPSKTIDQNYLTYQTLKDLDQGQRVEYWFPLVYSRVFKKKLNEDKELFDIIKKDMNFCAQTFDPSLYKDWINQIEALRDFDMRDTIQNITQPTLIISGSRDKMTIPGMREEMHEKMPNSKLEILNGLGHAFTIEDPEEANNSIWNFIQDNLG